MKWWIAWAVAAGLLAALTVALPRQSGLPRGALEARSPGPHVTAGGVELTVRGGFVRAIDGDHAVVRATSLTPIIDVRGGDRDAAVTLHVAGAFRRRGRTQCAITQGSVTKTKRVKRSLRLSVPKGSHVRVRVAGPPTEPLECDIVLLRLAAGGTAELHRALTRLAEDPPAFAVLLDDAPTPRAEYDVAAVTDTVEASITPVFVVSRSHGTATRLTFEHLGVPFAFDGEATDPAWPQPVDGSPVMAARLRVSRDGSRRVVATWRVPRASLPVRVIWRAATAWRLAARGKVFMAVVGSVVFAAWAAWAALGLCRLWGWLEHRPPAARRALAATAAIAVVIWLYFGGLGRLHLVSSNEGKRAQATAEMLATGDYVVPRLNGQVYLYKPPLHYWLAAPFWRMSWLPLAWRARLPAVVAGLACLVVVYAFAKRRFGRAEAFASLAVLATAPLFLVQAREAELDMLLCTMTTLSLCLLLPALESGRLSGFIVAGVALAGAVMTKGPVPLAIVALTVLGFLVLARGRSWRTLRGLLATGAVVVLLVAPWGVLVVRRIGWSQAWATFVEQSVRRVGTASRINSGPWHFYLSRLAFTFFPWSLLLPAALGCAVRDLRERPDRTTAFLLVWVGPSFLFFSACAGKEAQYILPLYPPLAILCGVTLVRWGRGDLTRRVHALAAVGMGTAGALLLVCGLAAPAVLALGALGGDLDGAFPTMACASLAGAVAGLLSIQAARKAKPQMQVAAAALALTVALTLHALELAPQVNAKRSPRGFCRRVSEVLPIDAPLFLYGFDRPSYTVYAGRVARQVRPSAAESVLRPVVAGREPAYVLMPPETFAQLRDQGWAFGPCLLAAHAGDPILLVPNLAAAP
jgi:4-amino-4-deoxy-L-arabinose transferase-like glycosyltransferase